MEVEKLTYKNNIRSPESGLKTFSQAVAEIMGALLMVALGFTFVWGLNALISI